MKKLYFGLFLVLLMVSAFIAPKTYAFVKNISNPPVSTQNINGIDHAAHHQNL